MRDEKGLCLSGANMEAEDVFKQTPLHLAAGNGHTLALQTLMESGAEKEVRDNRRQTPMHLATANGHEAVLQVLLGQNEGFIFGKHSLDNFFIFDDIKICLTYSYFFLHQTTFTNYQVK